MKGTAASKGPADWDQRFAEPGHAYGETVNDFLAGCAQGLPPGAALTLAEGEGRNAVWLAQQGHRVTAVDFSATGRDKALTMAMRAGVMIDYRLGDLADFDPGRGQWDLVAAIFSQPPAPVRRRLHGRLAQALRPGGRFILEAKAEAGGGPDSRYPAVEHLCAELSGLEIVSFDEAERQLQEGRYHVGAVRTARIVARKAV